MFPSKEGQTHIILIVFSDSLVESHGMLAVSYCGSPALGQFSIDHTYVSKMHTHSQCCALLHGLRHCAILLLYDSAEALHSGDRT